MLRFRQLRRGVDKYSYGIFLVLLMRVRVGNNRKLEFHVNLARIEKQCVRILQRTEQNLVYTWRGGENQRDGQTETQRRWAVFWEAGSCQFFLYLVEGTGTLELCGSRQETAGAGKKRAFSSRPKAICRLNSLFPLRTAVFTLTYFPPSLLVLVLLSSSSYLPSSL